MTDSRATADVLSRLRVTAGDGFRLDAFDPHEAPPTGVDKATAVAAMEAARRRLAAQQELLYANASWSLLVVVQAMDAAGKDGTIEHVMSGVNPQGIAITAFKAPGPDDLAHDFLRRASRVLPARGMIGLFNRSYYEEVLVPRVHPEVLARQKLPEALSEGRKLWDHRLEDIAAFERYLGRQGTRVVKFFLNVSRDEQKKRLLARLDEPGKIWKFDPGDVTERGFWADYMTAYQAAIAATATTDAPWFIIPADRKWYMRLLVVEAIAAALEDLALKPMRPAPDMAARLAEARRHLEAET